MLLVSRPQPHLTEHFELCWLVCFLIIIPAWGGATVCCIVALPLGAEIPPLGTEHLPVEKQKTICFIFKEFVLRGNLITTPSAEKRITNTWRQLSFPWQIPPSQTIIIFVGQHNKMCTLNLCYVYKENFVISVYQFSWALPTSQENTQSSVSQPWPTHQFCMRTWLCEAIKPTQKCL